MFSCPMMTGSEDGGLPYNLDVGATDPGDPRPEGVRCRPEFRASGTPETQSGPEAVRTAASTLSAMNAPLLVSRLTMV